jgi:hypothetical protein
MMEGFQEESFIWESLQRAFVPPVDGNAVMDRMRIMRKRIPRFPFRQQLLFKSSSIS